MRILLVSLNEETLPDPVYPLGLACLAGALDRAGHSWRLLDLSLDDREAVPRICRELEPELAAVSIRNIDNVAYPQSTSYIDDYKAIIKELRGSLSCPIVLGGSGFSLYPERIMTELKADFGIAGSGETRLLELVQALASGGDPGRVPNLLWSDGAGIQRSQVTTPDLPEAPPERQTDHLNAYLRLGGTANVQTRRGCPFGCVYCSYPLIEGRHTRSRSVEAVLAEIETLLAQGFRELFFVDSVFNHPLEYSKELCREIIRRNLDLRWSCYASPAPLDREALELYSRSGCIGLEFGTDALSEAMLRSLGKSFSPGQVEQAAAWCRELGLPHCHSILAGGPGETRQTLQETVRGLERLQPSAVVFMTGIRIIPGTNLEQTALQEGVIGPETDMLQPVFYLSPWLEPDLPQTVRALARRHKNWVFPGHSIRHSTGLAARVRRSGVRGPLWLNLTAASR